VADGELSGPHLSTQGLPTVREEFHESSLRPIVGDDFRFRKKLRSKPFGGRYQVKDVDRSADFYSTQLGFQLDRKNSPAFAQVSSGNLKLILSGPGASGSRPMPSGLRQGPGGRNRVVLEVADLPSRIENFENGGTSFSQ
jgi:predicted enzyme related to lactoylglutathione lyase